MFVAFQPLIFNEASLSHFMRPVTREKFRPFILKYSPDTFLIFNGPEVFMNTDICSFFDLDNNLKFSTIHNVIIAKQQSIRTNLRFQVTKDTVVNYDVLVFVDTEGPPCVWCLGEKPDDFEHDLERKDLFIYYPVSPEEPTKTYSPARVPLLAPSTADVPVPFTHMFSSPLDPLCFRMDVFSPRDTLRSPYQDDGLSFMDDLSSSESPETPPQYLEEEDSDSLLAALRPSSSNPLLYSDSLSPPLIHAPLVHTPSVYAPLPTPQRKRPRRSSVIPSTPSTPTPQKKRQRRSSATPGTPGTPGSPGYKSRGLRPSAIPCYDCNITESLEWRKGPQGEIFCNKCGLRNARSLKREQKSKY